MIVEKINEYLTNNELTMDDAVRYEVEKLAGYTFKRQFMDSSERDLKGKLYLSSAGKCARQLAYGYHGFEKAGKETDARSKLVFWMGDLVELTVVNLAKLAGVQIVGKGFDQATLKFSLNGTVITGHPDGLVLNGKIRLLEVKSMASYAFARFEKGDISEDYITQVNCYMYGIGVDECIFIAINKDSGVLGERIVKLDMNIVNQARANMLSVVESTPEKLPEPKFKANDKGELPWQCLYCAYWKHCKKAEKVLKGKKYILKELQEVA